MKKLSTSRPDAPCQTSNTKMPSATWHSSIGQPLISGSDARAGGAWSSTVA